VHDRVYYFSNVILKVSRMHDVSLGLT